MSYGDLNYWNSQPFWQPTAISKLNRWYDFGEIDKYCQFKDNQYSYYTTFWNKENSYALEYAWDRIVLSFPDLYTSSEKIDRALWANGMSPLCQFNPPMKATPRIPKETVLTGGDGIQRYAIYSQKTNASTGYGSATSCFFKLDGFKLYSYVALFYNAQPYDVLDRPIEQRLFTGRFNTEYQRDYEPAGYFAGPTLNPIHTPAKSLRNYAKGEACGTTDTFFINSLNYKEEDSVPRSVSLEKWSIISDTHFDLSWLSKTTNANFYYCDPLGRYGGNLYPSGFGEILWFEGELTTEERQKCEGYLAYKWNLQNLLADDHPYKNYPPPLYYVKGIVMDKTGVLAPNRKVYLINETNDEYYGSTTTDSTGSFSIQIPKGDPCIVVANLEPGREPLSYRNITPIAIPLEQI